MIIQSLFAIRLWAKMDMPSEAASPQQTSITLDVEGLHRSLVESFAKE